MSYNNIGGTYWYMGKYDQALAYHQNALAIKEEVLDGHASRSGESYSNIGVTYWNMGRYEQALEYHQKALAIGKKFGGTHLYLAISYNNKAAALTGLQQYKAAQDYLHKALTIFKENKHPRIIDAYGRMGLVALKLGNTSKAKEYFESL